MPEARRHEIFVELQVRDEAGYSRYREAMRPLLEARGGYFRRDYRVVEVLQGPGSPVNRVFVISFPDAAAKQAFFADEAYRAVRAAFFDAAVESGGVVAAYETAPA